MATIVHSSEDTPWLDRLRLPAYRILDAAKYAGIHQNTIYAWERTASPDSPRRAPRTRLSYLELIEIAFVAFFKNMGIPLRRIRYTHDHITDYVETDYPFVSRQFKTGRFSYHLLMEQDVRESPIWSARVVSHESNRRYSEDERVAEWFSRFDYEYEVVVRWRLRGDTSQVVIDPRISFGAPTVAGTPTQVIAGRHEAGETPAEIASDFVISETAVSDALHFENLPRVNGQTKAS